MMIKSSFDEMTIDIKYDEFVNMKRERRFIITK